MSVLARDLTAYRDALEQYQRVTRPYVRQAKAFDETIFRNAETGEPIGFVYGMSRGGNQKVVALQQSGVTNQAVRDYLGSGNYVASEYQPGVFVLRDVSKLSPVQYEQKSLTLPGQYDFFNRTPVQTVQVPDFSRPIAKQGFEILGDPYRPNPFNPNDAEQPRQYYAPAKPDDSQLPEFRGRAPTPTLAQLRRINEADLADVERGGLINDVIRGGGLAY